MRARPVVLFAVWLLLAAPVAGGGSDTTDAERIAGGLAEIADRGTLAGQPVLNEFDDHGDTCPLPRDRRLPKKRRRKLVKLGRKLFNSIDALGQQPSGGPTVRGQALSCATCHSGEGFSDGRTHIVGPTEQRDFVARHTPHLLRIRNTAPYGWDGRFDCLQAAIANAIVSPAEMNAARAPKQRQLDALAAFVETLDAPDAEPDIHYDRQLAAEGEQLFEDYRGVDVNGDFEAFDGIACIHCHVDPEGTDRKFHPILLPPPLLPHGGVDPGRVGPNGKVKGFKTPVLRGVRLTAPYFHDGSMGAPTGGSQSPPSRTAAVGPGNEQTVAALLEMMEAYRVRFAFDFTPREQLAIVHYLLSL